MLLASDTAVIVSQQGLRLFRGRRRFLRTKRNACHCRERGTRVGCMRRVVGDVRLGRRKTQADGSVPTRLKPVGEHVRGDCEGDAARVEVRVPASVGDAVMFFALRTRRLVEASAAA